MFHAKGSVNRRIIRRDRSSRAQRGLHQAGRARTGSARAAGRTAGTGAGSSSAESSYTAARCSLHHSSVDTTEESASLCAQNVGIGNRQVVAGDGHVQVVLERQVDGIFQRQVKFALANDVVEPRRIHQYGLWNLVRRVRSDRVTGLRHIEPNRGGGLRRGWVSRFIRRRTSGLRRHTRGEHCVRAEDRDSARYETTFCELCQEFALGRSERGKFHEALTSAEGVSEGLAVSETSHPSRS